MNKFETLAEMAIVTFNRGGDKFGETVTGVSDELSFSKMTNHYSKTVFLEQPDGHPCTSGIGFYMNGDGTFYTYSSGTVLRDVEITPELQAEFDKAVVYDY